MYAKNHVELIFLTDKTMNIQHLIYRPPQYTQ